MPELTKVKLPFLHHRIKIEKDLHSNEKLQNDQYIAKILQALAGKPDGLYSKNFFKNGEQPSNQKYPAIVSGGEVYLVYGSKKQKSHVSHNSETRVKSSADPDKAEQVEEITISDIKLAQNVRTKEWVVVKGIFDYCNNPKKTLSLAEKELEHLKLIGEAVGDKVLQRVEDDKPGRKIKFCILMKLAPGCDLVEFIKAEHSQISELGWIEIIIKILEAVQELHSKGFLHRDLKVENLMYDPASHTVRIIDYFALVKKNESGSATDILYGTGNYMDPYNYNMYLHTKAAKGPYYYDESTDVYALGVLFKIILKLPLWNLPNPDQYLDKPELKPKEAMSLRELYDTQTNKYFINHHELGRFVDLMTSKVNRYQKKVKVVKIAKDSVLAGVKMNGHAHANGNGHSKSGKDEIKTVEKTHKMSIKPGYSIVGTTEKTVEVVENFRPSIAECIEFFNKIHKQFVPITHIKVGIIDLEDFAKYCSLANSKQKNNLLELFTRFSEICIVNKNPILDNVKSRNNHYFQMVKMQRIINEVTGVPLSNSYLYITPTVKELCEVPANVEKDVSPRNSKVLRTYVYFDTTVFIAYKIAEPFVKAANVALNKMNLVISENEKGKKEKLLQEDALKEAKDNYAKLANEAKPFIQALKSATANQKENEISLREAGINVVDFNINKSDLDYKKAIKECLSKVTPPHYFIIRDTLLELCEELEAEHRIKFRDPEKPAIVMTEEQLTGEYRCLQIDKALKIMVDLRNKDRLSYSTVVKLLDDLQKDEKFTCYKTTSYLGRLFSFNPNCISRLQALKSGLETPAERRHFTKP